MSVKCINAKDQAVESIFLFENLVLIYQYSGQICVVVDSKIETVMKMPSFIVST